PACAKDRGGDYCLLQHLLHAVRVKEMKHIGQGKTVLFSQGNVQAVIGGRSLQFKIERATEPLAKRKSPRLVNPSAKRCVDDKLHTSALVKETLGNHHILAWDDTQDRTTCKDIIHRLLCASIIQPTFRLQPGNNFFGLGRILSAIWWDSLINLLAQPAQLRGKLRGATRRFAAPERNVRSRTMGIFN